MEFTYLKTFCEVVDLGNFSRVAEELGYSQSSVTTHIQRLEEMFGVVLFERFGRKMKLTQAGEVLLPYAREILELQAKAKTVLSEQTSGNITVGTIETLAAFYLPPYLQTFRQLYPSITISLRAGTEESLIQAVKEGQSDLGLILDRPCTDEELVSVQIRKEKIAIIAPPNSPLVKRSQIEVPELAQSRFILTEEGCTYRALLLQALRQTGVNFQIMSEFGSLEAIKQCVMHELGIAFLPEIAVAEEVQLGKLAAISLNYPSELYTQVVFLKKKWRSHAFEEFLELMTNH